MALKEPAGPPPAIHTLSPLLSLMAINKSFFFKKKSRSHFFQEKFFHPPAPFCTSTL